MTAITITALYQFVPLPDFRELKDRLHEFCTVQGIKGTILLADEGINGTVAGGGAAISALHTFLKSDARFIGLEHKESFAPANPFLRLKVRLKKEIVTMGVPGVDPNLQAGAHVDPRDWNELIAAPGTILIDTRNDYEAAIGTFTGAVNPGTVNFRDFPAWFEANRRRFDPRAKIAMFCTGGIRCEKATAFVKAQGYRDVFHLKGGILKYLETVPKEDSLWQGECFVFDNRVSVGHGLKPGPYDLCHACRMPVSEADKASPLYVEGVSCPHCHGRTEADKLASLAERQKQVELAKARGEAHVAADLEMAKAKKRRLRGSESKARKTG